MNIMRGAFINSPEWNQVAPRRMCEQKVKPEIEVFDMGHMRQAIDQGLFEDPPFVQFCMGVRWGIEGTARHSC